MKYAVEYDVHTEDNLKSFDPVVFPSEETIDDEEFDMIVKGKKDVIVEDFTTDGSHRNKDGSETDVIYTRGYIETDKSEDEILKLITKKESTRGENNESK